MFPLRVLSNPADRGSPPLRDSNDVVASQGVFSTLFQDAVPGRAEEQVLRTDARRASCTGQQADDARVTWSRARSAFSPPSTRPEEP